jgi:hypothetical protein
MVRISEKSGDKIFAAMKQAREKLTEVPGTLEFGKAMMLSAMVEWLQSAEGKKVYGMKRWKYKYKGASDPNRLMEFFKEQFKNTEVLLKQINETFGLPDDEVPPGKGRFSYVPTIKNIEFLLYYKIDEFDMPGYGTFSAKVPEQFDRECIMTKLMAEAKKIAKKCGHFGCREKDWCKIHDLLEGGGKSRKKRRKSRRKSRRKVGGRWLGRSSGPTNKKGSRNKKSKKKQRKKKKKRTKKKRRKRRR